MCFPDRRFVFMTPSGTQPPKGTTLTDRPPFRAVRHDTHSRPSTAAARPSIVLWYRCAGTAAPADLVGPRFKNRPMPKYWRYLRPIDSLPSSDDLWPVMGFASCAAPFASKTGSVSHVRKNRSAGEPSRANEPTQGSHLRRSEHHRIAASNSGIGRNAICITGSKGGQHDRQHRHSSV